MCHEGFLARTAGYHLRIAGGRPALPTLTGHDGHSAPKPVAVIEFLAETGVERWEVKLSSEKVTASGESAYLRISGSGCTFTGEIYKGMITPLYDNMTFKTASGKECKVMAIER